MIKLGDNNKTLFFFDSYNMMLERVGDTFGVGDALWRTSLALIASGLNELRDAIYLSCTYVNGKFRFLRHPTDESNTCSRDQSIMALVALKEHDNKEYRAIIKNLDFRISKKFVWRDAWLWAKERYKIWRITSIYHLWIWRLEDDYSIHLFCWMIWSSGQSMKYIKKRMLKKVVRNDNYLQRALLGDIFTEEDKIAIANLKPMNDFCWQRGKKGKPWINGLYLTTDESEYNNLALEVLDYILIRDYGLSIINTL